MQARSRIRQWQTLIWSQTSHALIEVRVAAINGLLQGVESLDLQDTPTLILTTAARHAKASRLADARAFALAVPWAFPYLAMPSYLQPNFSSLLAAVRAVATPHPRTPSARFPSRNNCSQAPSLFDQSYPSVYCDTLALNAICNTFLQSCCATGGTYLDVLPCN